MRHGFALRRSGCCVRLPALPMPIVISLKHAADGQRKRSSKAVGEPGDRTKTLTRFLLFDDRTRKGGMTKDGLLSASPADSPIAAQSFSRKAAGPRASDNCCADRSQRFFEILPVLAHLR